MFQILKELDESREVVLVPEPIISVELRLVLPSSEQLEENSSSNHSASKTSCLSKRISSSVSDSSRAQSPRKSVQFSHRSKDEGQLVNESGSQAYLWVSELVGQSLLYSGEQGGSQTARQLGSKSACQSAILLVSHSVSQSFCQSFCHSVSLSVSQSVILSVNLPFCQSFCQSFCHSVGHSVSQSIILSVSH